MLLGLQSNALKFTEAGSVTLRVSCEDMLFKFEVIDTGIGIPEEDQDKLFKLFGFLKDQR